MYIYTHMYTHTYCCTNSTNVINSRGEPRVVVRLRLRDGVQVLGVLLSLRLCVYVYVCVSIYIYI